MKKSIRPVLPVLILLLMLTHPSLSFEGAKSGLLLWFNVVLPTLLPFMLCSSLLVAWGGIPLLTGPFRPFLSRLGFSPDGSYALLAGLLCGYPMGAKTAADFLREGRISAEEARMLLAVAGCPSPMFLAGYVRMHIEPSLPFWNVLFAVYLPLFFLALLAGRIYGVKKNRPAQYGKANAAPAASRSFDGIFMDCLEIMVRIGGYIMLYSILAAFLASLRLPFGALLMGFTEMTTGIEAIAASLTGLPAAAAVTAAAAFGGLSGISQTQTVIKNAGLSIRHYVLWKLVHASLSASILLLIAA